MIFLISCTTKPLVKEIISCSVGIYSEDDFVSFEIKIDNFDLSRSKELSILDWRENELPVLSIEIVDSNNFYLILNDSTSINAIKSKKFFIKSDSGKIIKISPKVKIFNCD